MQKNPNGSIVLETIVETHDTRNVLFAAYEFGAVPGAQSLQMQRRFHQGHNPARFETVTLDSGEVDVLLGATRWLLDEANHAKIEARIQELGAVWAKYENGAVGKSEPSDEAKSAAITRAMEHFEQVRKAAAGIIAVFNGDE